MFSVEHKRVLVVDDQDADRSYLRYLLNQLGFTKIHEADGSRAAIHQLQSEVIDLVIADWNMPKVDGLMLYKLMRKFPETRTIPFVMASNQNNHDKVRSAIASGIDNYIIKPVTAEALRRAVDSVLARR